MAFVGEAFLSASLQVILEKLASPIIKEIKLRWGIDKEVKKLGMMLAKIQVVLDDAEHKEIRDNSVKIWLNDLKDIAYDVDDIMDELAYEIERSKLEGEAESEPNQVWSLIPSLITNTVPFKQMIAAKIKDLIERLEELESTRVMLGLREGVGGSRMESRERLKTSSVIDESGIAGRVDDREKIVELLLSDEPSGNDITVIPIVGMGGLGKTTLVQAVYNDKRVEGYFEMKAWVCVSEEFDLMRLSEAILESATMGRKYDFKYLDALQVSLKHKLRGKRFLLVLDDVWNEKQNDWDVLRAPFGVGALGSKILVTTRSHKVSLIMGTIPPYDLGGLPNEDCWSLFKKCTFAEGNPNPPENLEIIGKKIVKKCKGSPLAVKILGGLLRSNEDVEKWEYVLNTEMWDLPAGNDYILGVLRLSYHHLPSYLKQSFAYCSIYPKDYKIEKEVLVRLWIAEGFVQPEGRRCLEDIGNEYFDNLFSRSFFQHSNWEKRYYVMHDLVHDLAQSILGEICCRLENQLSDNITERTRHLSLLRSGNFELFYKAKSLRTLFSLLELTTLQPPRVFFENLECLRVLCLDTGSMSDIPNSVFNLKHLRYLQLSWDESLHRLPESIGRLLNLQILILKKCAELPNSIGNLKQLRYLEVIDASLEMLPESIASLFNLQTLILGKCYKLRELPKDIGNLIGLRILYIMGCVALVSLPLGFGKLTNIQNLWWFPLSRGSGAKLGDLKDLNLVDKFALKGSRM